MISDKFLHLSTWSQFILQNLKWVNFFQDDRVVYLFVISFLLKIKSYWFCINFLNNFHADVTSKLFEDSSNTYNVKSHGLSIEHYEKLLITV